MKRNWKFSIQEERKDHKTYKFKFPSPDKVSLASHCFIQPFWKRRTSPRFLMVPFQKTTSPSTKTNKLRFLLFAVASFYLHSVWIFPIIVSPLLHIEKAIFVDAMLMSPVTGFPPLFLYFHAQPSSSPSSSSASAALSSQFKSIFVTMAPIQQPERLIREPLCPCYNFFVRWRLLTSQHNTVPEWKKKRTEQVAKWEYTDTPNRRK